MPFINFGSLGFRLPPVVVPSLPATVIPAIAVAFAMPDPASAGRTHRAAHHHLVASAISPLVVDPATISMECLHLLDSGISRKLFTYKRRGDSGRSYYAEGESG